MAVFFISCRFKSCFMKKNVLIYLSVLGVFLFGSACNSDYDKFKKLAGEARRTDALEYAQKIVKNTPGTVEAKEAQEYIDKAQNDSIKSIRAYKKDIENKKLLEEQKLSSLKKIEILEKKFLLLEDEFDKTGTYVHKTFGKNWPHRKTLIPYISQNGTLAFSSNYWADDWIFHSTFRVKIGGKIIDGPVINMYSKNMRHEVVSGGIYENNYYADESVILKNIAESNQEIVTVRFIGKQYYNDSNLSKNDILAIKESVELSELLKKVQ